MGARRRVLQTANIIYLYTSVRKRVRERMMVKYFAIQIGTPATPSITKFPLIKRRIIITLLLTAVQADGKMFRYTEKVSKMYYWNKVI